MQKIKIYPAASLFNGRETFFNIHLVNLLEREKGYVANLPQRDGFESGNLARVLAKILPAEEVSRAMAFIIYTLDIGKFIPESHVIIANLDEPLDAGVDVEQCYAKIMGKFVIGFRTDVRNPFGTSDWRGMHFFPTYQCNVFISHNMPAENKESAEKEMKDLAGKIHLTIQENKSKLIDGIQKSALKIPAIESVMLVANGIFDGLNDIHSEESLKEIAKRYLANKELLLSLGPKTYK